MPLTPATRLGSYEIVAPLGAGGMGEVYRARDTKLGREVALKVLPTDVSTSADRLARFEREARAVASLNHPNIVTLYSAEEAEGVRFLTMELVEGQSLDRHAAPGALPIARVIDIAIAVSDALAAAHEKGVVHRDLKPANVIVARDGRIKVVDFGLAKLSTGGRGLEVTMTAAPASPISTLGQVVGTVPYMSPEQIRGSEVDARSDVFSLGIMLYELSTGRRPFGGESSADISSSILRDVPEPPTHVRAGLPSDLDRIVSRTLEKDPRARFPSALDLSNELRRLRSSLEQRGRESPKSVSSVAILPFVNRSRDEEDEYFADGLADELLNVLGKIRGLRVAARTSSFQFKGKNEDLAVIGQKLNVATLLEGSVRKAGNRVRISVQLVKVEDGYHLWSETYDRSLDDIFAVQDEIAQAVVKELRTTLLGEEPDSDASGEAKAEVAAAAKGRGTDAEAHRLFLQGSFFLGRLAEGDLARAEEYLREALARDPAHALAWSQLSRALASQASYGYSPIIEGIARAREAALRALQLEPSLAEAHLALANIQILHDWDWKSADASIRRVLALTPGNAEALRLAGVVALAQGHVEEALQRFGEAAERDPLHAAGQNLLGRTYNVAGKMKEAEAAYRKALAISPEGAAFRYLLAMMLYENGRAEEAMAELRLETAEWAQKCGLAILHDAAGRAAESEALLQELIRECAHDSAAQISFVYAERGERDAAFEWLERAYQQRDSGLVFAKVLGRYRSLHGDPRWLPFLKKMGVSS